MKWTDYGDVCLLNHTDVEEWQEAQRDQRVEGGQRVKGCCTLKSMHKHLTLTRPLVYVNPFLLEMCRCEQNVKQTKLDVEK